MPPWTGTAIFTAGPAVDRGGAEAPQARDRYGGRNGTSLERCPDMSGREEAVDVLFATLLIPPALLGAVLALGRYEESMFSEGPRHAAPGRHLRVVPDPLPADGRISRALTAEPPEPPRAA